MGMNMSVAITVFFQQSVQRGKLPFEVLGDPFYSESNIRELERRAREMDAGNAGESTSFSRASTATARTASGIPSPCATI